MGDTVRVPAGEAFAPPPAGTAWVFRRTLRDGSTDLEAIPHVDGAPDPTPPAGCTWRLVKARGQQVYIAMPDPFLHHPRARRLAPDLA